MKHPLLHAMRAKRQREETEIRSPLERELRIASSAIQELRSSLRALERVVGSKMAERVIDHISHSVSAETRRQVQEAFYKASPKLDPMELVTFTVSAGSLLWSDPNSLLNEILQEWKERAAPRAYVRADRP